MYTLTSDDVNLLACEQIVSENPVTPLLSWLSTDTLYLKYTNLKRLSDQIEVHVLMYSRPFRVINIRSRNDVLVLHLSAACT